MHPSSSTRTTCPRHTTPTGPPPPLRPPSAQVEWDPLQLRWADFRYKVLGTTDPAGAAGPSLRSLILQRWRGLGLPGEPTVQDNGVHASASPFEAMAERLNWLGADVHFDEFGAALLQAGVPMATLTQWLDDPQVEFEGQRTSVFDLLQDLDAPSCVRKAQLIAGVTGPVMATKNTAFVFVKPHAVTPAVIDLVKDGLAQVPCPSPPPECHCSHAHARPPRASDPDSTPPPPMGGGGEKQGTWASRTQKHSEAGYGRPVDRGV